MALAKFVFEARGIEPVANNLADKIRLCLDLRFLGPKQTGVAQFNDRPFRASKIAELSRRDWRANSRVIQAYVRAEADFRSRSDSSIGGQSK